MADRRLWGAVFSILMVVFISACSSSEEINSAKDTETAGTSFEGVDSEEAIIPETDEPVEIEVVEDEDVPEAERPVPVRTPAEKVPARSEAPARQETPAHQETPAPTTVPERTAPADPDPVSVAPRSGTMMWSVQLGAFKNESGAFDLVEELKKKFNQPVYKRYDPATGYYKVTLGSFQNRDQAGAFKLEVQSQGYPDAFTVEVAR